MRRQRQQLSDEESIGILQKATSGTLALLGDGGYPYAVPISYVYDDGKLYFRSVIAFGRIHIVEDEEEKRSFARTLGNRYNPNQEEALRKELEHGLSRMLAIRLDIEHLTGKEAIELVRAHSHQPVTTDKKE